VLIHSFCSLLPRITVFWLSILHATANKVADLALATATTISSLQESMTTLPPPPDMAFISVDALKAALAKLKVTSITATQLLQAVREEENNLYSRPKQTGAVLPCMCLHSYASNLNYSDGMV
jgi:hypothetical protein